MPLTAIRNASGIVQSNLFESTYNYTNILSSNDLLTNSPLNGESSTLKSFFMSEMDRFSTVKTVTGMDLEWVINI